MSKASRKHLPQTGRTALARQLPGRVECISEPGTELVLLQCPGDHQARGFFTGAPGWHGSEHVRAASPNESGPIDNANFLLATMKLVKRLKKITITRTPKNAMKELP
ncbi:MAG: hypothetical protein QF541_08635 [Lentisphaeria bacterium]|jgi:hypothetical protein|nr:hypothetical protein [Lentisphaeria bacterium]